MEQEKFDRIAEAGVSQLRALLSPMVGAFGGDLCAYNAYVRGLEVVVLAYQREEPGNPGHVVTKPVAIVVDDELFAELEVDGEAGRVDGQGHELPPKVRTT